MIEAQWRIESTWNKLELGFNSFKEKVHNILRYFNKWGKRTEMIQKYTDMLRTWERVKKCINSEFIKCKLIEARNSSNDIRIVWDIIWDCVLYSTLFIKSENDNYFTTFIDKLYNLYSDWNLNGEEKSIEKAKIIVNAIANYLGITATEENSKKIQEYFLEKYNKNWFVYHSFPSAYFESISGSWLQAKNENKSDNTTYDDIERIQKIFTSHWIFTALWWAWIYGWKGIYFDHKQWNIYPHAIFWPERFCFFTSSNHYTVNSWLNNEPFVFRDREQCRKNVVDLCNNAWLNDNEKWEVISFFEKKYDELSKSWSYFALIPKAKVWKTDIKFPEYIWYIPISKDDSKSVHTQYKELINIIRYTLGDWWKGYKEHEWNVYHDSINPTEMVMIKLPEIKEIITEDIKFNSETKEELTDKEKINKSMSKIRDLRKTAPDRVPEWIINSFDDIDDMDDESSSEEMDECEISLKIRDIFWLTSLESIEFKWKMIEYFDFYNNRIIPIIRRLKKELKGTENEILQHNKGYNHWFNTHTKNVVIRWIFYALLKWINPVPVIIACATHDLKNTNIPWGWDKNHWYQALSLVDLVVKEYNKIWAEKIDKKTKNKIKYAVKNHMSDHWEPDSEPIAQCLNDADRTRLAWSDSYQEKYFSTDVAKIIANWKKREFIRYIRAIWIDYDRSSNQ